MKFDRLCGLAERHYQNHVVQVACQKARIFDLPVVAHEDLDFKKYYDSENFYLPFPVIAIEDKTSCVILMDSESKQIGFDEPRYFIEIVCGDTPKENFKNSDIDNWPDKNICYVTEGMILNCYYTDDTIMFDGALKVVNFFNKKEHLKTVPGQIIQEETQRSMLQNIATGILEILYFSDPEMFVLEGTSTKRRKNKKMIPRAEDRPRYWVMKPDRIRDRMNISLGGHVCPHERRRHDRYYRSERYSKGRTIKYDKLGKPYYLHKIIDAIWVGTSKKTVGNTLYKVRVDL
jgi:hypothetical protein